MDLSKLPRMSKTDAPPPAEAAPLSELPPVAQTSAGLTVLCPHCAAPLRAGAKFCDKCGAQLPRESDGRAAYGFGAEAWLSVGIGILLLFFVPSTLGYVSSKIFHTHFAPFDGTESNERVDYLSYTDGSKVYYRDTTNYWSDLAVTTFALALIAEGIALILSRKPVVIFLALVLTVSATLFNLFYFIATYSKQGLIAPLSGIAVIFGGYMTIFQFGLLQATRRVKPGQT